MGLAALALAAASCGGPGGARGGPGMPPMPVEVAELTPQTVRDGFTALGTIDAENNVEIVSELAGTVRELPFAEGRPVAAGALLAVLDDREERAEADRAAALVEQLRLTADRTDKLFAERLVPAEEKERADANRKVAEANLAVARARLDKTRIRAPFAGVVGWRRVSVGAYVRAGDVITDLAQTDVMRVSFAAPERFASELKRGAKVTLTTTAYPGRTFVGTVDIIDPQVDPGTRTFDLIAHIPNPDGRLRPGMSANVTATIAERPGALMAPSEAIVVQGDQNVVFAVQPDSTVQIVPVRLGVRDEARVEIVSGLAQGATVVKAGHQKLFPGAKVMPVPEGGMAGPPGGGGPGAPGGGAPGGPAGAAAGDTTGPEAAGEGKGK